jgi:hypothetical protein
VRLAAFGGLLGRTPLARQERALAAGDGAAGWQTSLAALERLFEQLFEQRPVRGAALSVAVSSQWLRFVLVPQREELRSKAERLEYARHLFATRFGVEAEGWTVRLVEGTALGAQLACAMAPGLIADLQALCARAGVTLRRVEPLALAVFNAHDKQLGEGRHWFVVPEAGTAFVALLDGGVWQGVAVRRAAIGSPADLAGLLEAEHQFLGVEERVAQVMAGAREGLAQTAEECGYRFAWLDAAGTQESRQAS